jgi:4-hydroxybenzoate polyprenyltransferase
LGQEIRTNLKRLLVVSRPEFIPANMGSLIIGLAWGYETTQGFSINLLVMTILSFLVITIVSAIGAQLNTLSDLDLDSMDPRKKSLTQNLRELEPRKVKMAILFELLLSGILVSLLVLMRGELIQLAIYFSALILTQAYSALPLRLKGRSILAMISLSLVLSVLPAIFIYLTFTRELSMLFIFFLIGQTLTVYSVIIPTETRDYFGDKAMSVMTMTVWLGLSRATLLALALLAVGATLSISAFLMTPTFIQNPLLMLAPLTMIGADLYILRAYDKLYNLSKRQEIEEGDEKGVIGEEVVELSSKNPKWITIITQAIIFVNIIYLIGKIFL